MKNSYGYSVSIVVSLLFSVCSSAAHFKSEYYSILLYVHLSLLSLPSSLPSLPPSLPPPLPPSLPLSLSLSVILLVSFHSPEVIFEQLSLIYQLPRYLVRSFRLIMPFFPTATMERVDTEGQIVTAKVSCLLPFSFPFSFPSLFHSINGCLPWETTGLRYRCCLLTYDCRCSAVVGSCFFLF